MKAAVGTALIVGTANALISRTALAVSNAFTVAQKQDTLLCSAGGAVNRWTGLPTNCALVEEAWWKNVQEQLTNMIPDRTTAEWLQSIYLNGNQFIPDQSTLAWARSRYEGNLDNNMTSVIQSLSEVANTHAHTIGGIVVTVVAVKALYVTLSCLKHACGVRSRQHDNVQGRVAGNGKRVARKIADDHIKNLLDRARLDALIIVNDVLRSYKVDSKE